MNLQKHNEKAQKAADKIRIQQKKIEKESISNYRKSLAEIEDKQSKDQLRRDLVARKQYTDFIEKSKNQ